MNTRTLCNNMKLIFCVTLILMMTAELSAQSASNSELRSRIGLFGNVDYSIHSASFTKLPEIPNCCPEFSSATHMGILFGLAYISPINETFTLHIRMHYWSYGADFSVTETLNSVDLEGGPSTATIQHDLTTSHQQISLEPLIGYHLSRDLSLLGGVTAGYVFSATYDQKETLITPEDGLFANQSRQRNVDAGDIDNINALGIGVTLGASYDIALNEERSIFLSPEILFTISPMDLVQDVSWSAQHIRAGLALSFAPPEIEDTLTELELYEFAKTLTPPTKGTPGIAFTSSLVVTGVGLDGRTTSGSSVRIEEFASARIRPLLPYIFFDHGASTIPVRYRALGEEQTASFSMGNFYNLDAMVTYYHMLNIIGKRLTETPSASLTLTGYTDPTEESAGPTLAQQRANAVRSYLTTAWNINASRINVDAKGLPSSPSNQTTADGQAENRRVEISASDPKILASVESVDTMRVAEPAGLRFQPAIDPTVPIATWTVFISANDALIKTFHNGDPVPPSVEWNISEKMQYIPRGTMQLKALLAVRDSAGAVIPSTSQTISVSEVTLDDKAKSGGVDKSIDRYSLILFGVDQSELTKDHVAMVDLIKTKIGSNAKVNVIGYTDRSGSDDHNAQLSGQRAKAVARALGVPENSARGVGERLPLYDNSNPEGRFYSRTVEVLVETPRR